jgi:tripartite-type tricarboxylate transporter receptor subunit TctC
MIRFARSLGFLFLGYALAGGAGMSAAVGTAEAATDWPKKSITVVIPTRPGGSADQTLLPLKTLMEKELGVSLLYSYKPGAGGELGWSIVHQKGADGYTIGGFWTPHMQNTTIFQKPPYKIDDFAPLGIITGDVPMWFTYKGGALKDMTDLIAAAKKDPDTVMLAIGSFTGEHYITVLSVEKQAKADFRVVAVHSGSKVTSNILGKHFEVGVSRPLSVYSVRDEIHCLGVAAEKRSEAYPYCKTFAEQLPADVKVPNLTFAIGMMTHSAFKKNDPEGWAKLEAAFRKVVQSEEYAKLLKRGGRTVTYMDPAGATKLVNETAGVMTRYLPLINEAKTRQPKK